MPSIQTTHLIRHMSEEYIIILFSKNNYLLKQLLTSNIIHYY
jgi:hypothetical protein